MISTLDEMDMIVGGLEVGAEDYLSKPLNAALLEVRIAASLDRKFLGDREKAAQARLRLEQKRSDNLLRNVLPNVIVERLR
jgi:adenylate cyclase